MFPINNPNQECLGRLADRSLSGTPRSYLALDGFLIAAMA